ncbi:MAG TPA: AraC family transcriptional regulator [Chitinophagaceae bacterium]|nr:AraC family transcriptional regulator [Chitinophagaceae bacterium]
MQLYIRNMVCDRCVMAVRQVLTDEGIRYHQVKLGEVELLEQPSAAELEVISSRLRALGFELLDDKKSRIVEKIKNTIISVIHQDQEELNLKLSAILSEKLGLDYHYLTTLFSSVEGITIEKYTILQRIEKVKELMMYNEMSLSEIAFNMGYSSVQHLSQQFKKVTGLTPSRFRELKENKRSSLDKVFKQ